MVHLFIALLITWFLAVLGLIANRLYFEPRRFLKKGRRCLDFGDLENANSYFATALARLRQGEAQEEAYHGLLTAYLRDGDSRQAQILYHGYIDRYARPGLASRKWLSQIQELCAVFGDGRAYAAKDDPEVKVRSSGPAELTLKVAEASSQPPLKVRPKGPALLPDLTPVLPEVRSLASESSLEAARSARRLGPYLIGDSLGEGGFGAVYEGYLPVAIKLLKDPERAPSLARLAELQQKIASPRIVAPIAVDTEHDPPYLVMERIEGPDMRALLKERGRLPPAEALSLIRELALGLADAHKAGIAHLDLKPENVLLGPDGQVKLTDFELGRDEAARENLKASLASVDDSKLQGSIAYMSPEQRQGGELGPLSDLYTAGVMLFEALTGRHPAPGDRLRDWIPELPEACDRVFEGCFVRAERRFASAEELIAALDKALAALSTERPPIEEQVPEPEPAPEKPKRLPIDEAMARVQKAEPKREAKPPEAPERALELEG